MKISFLRNYIKLVQYKSFSELAKDLSISQSTLSNQIFQLENYLLVKLIERTTRKFNLTEAGKDFYNTATNIIELLDSAKKELLKYNKNFHENIIISSSKLPGSHILPKYIAKFKNEFPDVNFDLKINNSLTSLENLKNMNVDFAGIGSFMTYDINKFDYIKIGEEKLIIACSPTNDLLKNNNKLIKFQDIIKYPVISREKGSGTRNIIEQQFSEYKKLKIELEINDNDSIISTISESNYIAILSESIAKKAEKAGLIKILKIKEYPIIAKRNIYFIKLKERDLNDIKKKFWNYLS